MNTFKLICRAVGALMSAIGVLSIINTMFNLRLRVKGTSLPNDYIGAFFLLFIGLIFLGVWLLLHKKSKAKIKK